MVKCSVCLREIKKGTGTMFVYRTGDIKYFCSLRCRKNELILKRKLNPKELRKPDK